MVREASGDEQRGRRGSARRDAGPRRWSADDEREAARWLGRDATPADDVTSARDATPAGATPGDDVTSARDATPGDAAPVRDRRADVLARVRATPRGFVRTYGDVSPGAPRFAGTVLHGTHDPDLPWFRIVRADGSLTQGMRQRKLLEAEGVPFRGDKVDMRAARVP